MILPRSLRMALQPCIPPISRNFSYLSVVQSPSKMDDNPDFFRYTSGRWMHVSSITQDEHG